MADRIDLANLQVRVGTRTLLHDVALTIEAGRVVGLVGSSGCGKTMTARALLGMVDLVPGVVTADLSLVVGDEVHRPWARVLGADESARDRAFTKIRGRIVGYLPQDARASLDPLLRVGRQVRTAAALRTGNPEENPRPWLLRAGLKDPERVEQLFPHELSGGMAQRVAIAQALARGSRFLIADEPTTGLDPTVQRGILDEIRRLASEGMGVLFITHDLRILPGLADEVLVMEDGRVVERLTAERLRDGELASAPGRRLVEATRRVAGGRLG